MPPWLRHNMKKTRRISIVMTALILGACDDHG